MKDIVTIGGIGRMKTWTKEERYRVLKDKEEIRPLHEKIIQSDYRQHYHIQSVTGLLNDPNGFVYHDGVWHLFYQWCPWGAVHGLKYWYHTVSDDLVRWRNVGVCIRPTPNTTTRGRIPVPLCRWATTCISITPGTTETKTGRAVLTPALSI